MPRIAMLVLLTVVLAVGLFVTKGGSEEKPRKDFLSMLQGEKTIALKEADGRYEITLMKGVPLDHRVLAVESDYIVLEDIVGITEIRIPIYSIKSIRRLRVPTN